MIECGQSPIKETYFENRGRDGIRAESGGDSAEDVTVYVIGLYFSTISKMEFPFVLHDVLTGVYSVVSKYNVHCQRY